MKIGTTVFFIILIVALLGCYLTFFQVRETEAALVMRLGKPLEPKLEPNFYFKWPSPIDRVYKFDTRLQVFEAQLGETPTKGAVPIIVNSYVVWRVKDPLQFYNAVGSIKQAKSKLSSQLSDTQNTVIGRHSFSDFVNNDPEAIQFEQIETEMVEIMKPTMLEQYGIEVVSVGIKRLQVSEDVSKDVFDRMSAERNRQTEKILTQGKAESTKIRTEAEAKRTELLAAAEARAKAIRGEGDAEAARYYKMLEANEELAIFLREIESLKTILKDRSTIVLSAESEPYKMLREMPDLLKNDN